MYPSLWAHIDYFHCPLKVLCPPLTHFRLPQLPFPKYHIVGIIQYTACSDLTYFLSHMHLSFHHVLSRTGSPSLPRAESHSLVWITELASSLTHCLLKGILGVSEFWQFMKKAAINRFLCASDFSTYKSRPFPFCSFLSPIMVSEQNKRTLLYFYLYGFSHNPSLLSLCTLQDNQKLLSFSASGKKSYSSFILKLTDNATGKQPQTPGFSLSLFSKQSGLCTSGRIF